MEIYIGICEKTRASLMLTYNAARLAGQIAQGGKIKFPWDSKRERYSSKVREMMREMDEIDRANGLIE